jgi:hypothetical protein
MAGIGAAVDVDLEMGFAQMSKRFQDEGGELYVLRNRIPSFAFSIRLPDESCAWSD